MLKHVGIILVRINWLDFCCLLFGVVLLSEFVILLQNGFFSADQQHARLLLLSQEAANTGIAKLLLAVSAYTSLLAPLCGIVLFIVSVCLCLLISRTWMMYSATFILGIYFVFHLSIKTTWLFEYLLPLLFAIVVSLAKTSDFVLQGNHKFLGYKLFNSPKLMPKFIFWVVSTALLFGCALLAKNSGHVSFMVASIVSASYMLLLIISLCLDSIRIPRKTYHDELVMLKEKYPGFYQLHHFPWLSLMGIIVGAMLTFQVFENQLLNWFTLDGYKSLIIIYRDYSNSPGISGALNYAINHAEIFMAVQMAVEVTLALLLVIQIFRFPTIFVTFFFFLALTYIEFGVPASWPATASSEVTWLWELLLCTIIVFVIGGYQLGKFIVAKNTQKALLGESVFGHTRLPFRFFIAFAAGLLLALIIVSGHEVEEFNLTLAVASGLNLFFYVGILAVIDLVRTKNTVRLRLK